MRALTLHQPMASLIGIKDVENRKWKPPDHILGKRIAIHAGKTWNEEHYRWAVDLAREVDTRKILDAMRIATTTKGCIVSTALVIGWYDNRNNEASNQFHRKLIQRSPWFNGPVGWLMGDVRKTKKPIPCKGMMGLWTIPSDIEQLLKSEPGTEETRCRRQS